MTEKTFGTVAGILSAMPAQQRWDDGVATGYAIALRDVDDKSGLDAVIQLLKTEDYRPSPASILRKIRMMQCGETSVTQMFNRICRYLSDVHPMNRTEKEAQWLSEGELHPFDVVAIKYIGGWGRAGSMDRERLLKALDGWTNDSTENVKMLVQNDVKRIAE
jgi:hypothetical protein